MKIPCSSCNQRLEIPEELAGQTIDCPACNATLAVPALETPPPAVPQVQESAPQAASSKKSKSSIPKWAIASVAGIAVVVVGLIMFFPDKAVKTDEESQRPSPPAEAKPIEPVAEVPSQQSAPSPESKPVEPVAEASQPEPPTAEAPAISIHVAARYGNIEAVKQHIDAGTDVNAKDAAGWMPLDMVEEGPLRLRKKHTEIADLLRKHGGKTQAWFKAGDSIHIAAGAGHIEAVKQHLVDGANVNARRATRDAPLHVAALGGRKEVAELLISKGADVNAKILSGVLKGETPLDFAIIRNHTEFADLLRKHGGKTGEELKAAGK